MCPDDPENGQSLQRKAEFLLRGFTTFWSISGSSRKQQSSHHYHWLSPAALRVRCVSELLHSQSSFSGCWASFYRKTAITVFATWVSHHCWGWKWPVEIIQPTPCSNQGKLKQLFRAMPSWVLNISKDWDSTSLGIIEFLVILMLKMFFLFCVSTCALWAFSSLVPSEPSISYKLFFYARCSSPLNIFVTPHWTCFRTDKTLLSWGAQHWTQHSQFVAPVLSRVEGSCIHPLKLCLKRWKALLGAQWRPHQSSELPGGLSKFCLYAALHPVLLSEQTKACVCKNALSLRVAYSWARLVLMNTACDGNWMPRDSLPMRGFQAFWVQHWGVPCYEVGKAMWYASFETQLIWKIQEAMLSFCSLPVHLVCSYRKRGYYFGVL